MIQISKNKDFILKTTSYLIIGIGIFLRLAQYFSNKSLWKDEAMLALNIIDRNLVDLLKPLDYAQHAPPGFLIIEKLIINILGPGEFAFRLFPLICGIASLFLFYKLVKKCLSPLAVPIALILFSVLLCLNYYSSEAKQYSSDLFFALLLILMAINFKEKPVNIFYFIIYALAGVLVIWFSHTSVFVLFGTGLTIFTFLFLRKENSKAILIFASYLLWIFSFLTFYFFSASHIVKISGLINYWSNFYIPFPLHSTADFLKYKVIIREFFRFTSLDNIAGVCLLIGLVCFYQKKKDFFYLMVTPVLLTLIASAFHRYPIFERFILFLLPVTICFISEGVEWIRAKTWKRFPFVGIIVIILLLYKPIDFTRINFTSPLTQEEIKPVLIYVKEHLKNNDVIYLVNQGQYAFKYYANTYGFCSDFLIERERKDLLEKVCNREKKYTLFIGPDPINRWDNIHKLEKLRGNKRAWLIFTDMIDTEKYFKDYTLNYIDKIGIKTGSFVRPGVTAYLYDLSIRTNH